MQSFDWFWRLSEVEIYNIKLKTHLFKTELDDCFFIFGEIVGEDAKIHPYTLNNYNVSNYDLFIIKNPSIASIRLTNCIKNINDGRWKIIYSREDKLKRILKK